jgi:hypothetical protein
MILGRPISVWDCGEKFADRYTVVYLDTEDARGNVQYAGMSASPFHPQGFGQHGEMPLFMVACQGRGGAFKKRIRFVELPDDCKKLVQQDLKEMST